MKWWQWILAVLGGLVVLFGVPYLLNTVILSEQRFEIVGEGKDWLMFWVTWLSAIASFVMVFITWWTLWQNKAQVDELKRQWEEQNKPDLYMSITRDDYWFYLTIKNSGNTTATDTTILIDEIYISSIPKLRDNIESTIASKLNGIIQNKTNIPKGDTRNFRIFQHTQSGVIIIGQKSPTPEPFLLVKEDGQYILDHTMPITVTYSWLNKHYKKTEDIVVDDSLK